MTEQPRAGKVTVVRAFPVPQLETSRALYIYLPPEYDESDARYPVLYMHDAQNLFDETATPWGSWCVHEAMDRMAPSDQVIVVGVAHGGAERRMDEYVPVPSPKWGIGGLGGRYIEFLVGALKPFIDGNYRTRPEREETGIAGSSAGAYISLWAGLTHPSVFSRVGAFSMIPDLGDDGVAIARLVRDAGAMREAAAAGGFESLPLRVYIDIGAREDEQFPGAVEGNRRLADALRATGLGDENVRLVVDPDAIHNEVAWKKRFPAAFEWLWR